MSKIGPKTTSTQKTPQKPKTSEVAKKNEGAKAEAGKSQTQETAKHGKGPSVDKAKEGSETRDSKESGRRDEAGRPEDKTELSKEAQESGKLSDEDKSELAELLKKLSENLEEGAKEPDKKIEDKGGACCGRPKQPDKIVAGETDWNQLLMADILAVRAHQLTGGRSPAAAPGNPNGQKQDGVPGIQGQGRTQAGPGQSQPNPAKPAGGEAARTGGNGNPGGTTGSPLGGNGPQGVGGAATGGQGQPQDPLARLSSNYNRAKSAGAQLDEKVEKEVKQLLGIADNNPNGQDLQATGANLGGNQRA